MNQPRYPVLPAAPGGARLYPCHQPWAIIRPRAGMNLMPNPSGETSLIGYNLFGLGDIERTTDRQWAGAYSIRLFDLEDDSGVEITITNGLIQSGEQYVFSLYMWAQPGKEYIFNPSGLSFRLHGVWWQRVEWPIIATSDGTLQVQIYQRFPDGSNEFYIDGVQLETGSRASTYIDGDIRGFNLAVPDYVWLGTPHASASSRSGDTRHGGDMIWLDLIGVWLTAVLGLGLATHETTFEAAAMGGSIPGRTIVRDRVFSLIGRIYGDTMHEADTRRALINELINAAQPGRNQPFVLYHAGAHQRPGAPIPSHYPTRMQVYPTPNTSPGGTIDTVTTEPITLEFRQALPLILRDGGAASPLDPGDSIANPGFLTRAPDGRWSIPGGVAFDGPVNAVVRRPDGGIYFGGTFTNAGGVADADNLGYWDGNEIHAVGTTGGIVGTVYALAVAPDGVLYVGGLITNAGGVAVNNIASFNPATGTWAALGAGVNDAVYALELGTDASILYVGGEFTAVGGGGATLNYLARWNRATSAWQAFTVGLNTGANDIVYGIKRAAFGQLYIVGEFTGITGVSTRMVALYNGSVFLDVGNGVDLGFGTKIVNLAIWQDDLYVIGDFTRIGEIEASYIASWNGDQWTAVSDGLSAAASSFPTGLIPRRSSLLIGAATSTIAPFAATDWDGASFAVADISGLGPPLAGYESEDGTLYLGVTNLSSNTVSGVVTVDNPGTMDAIPIIKLYGPTDTVIAQRVYHLKNVTDGTAIYFDLALNRGEIATLILDPLNISFESNFRGDIIDTILPQSNQASWTLVPGDNDISLYTQNATMAGTIQFTPVFASLSDSVIGRR